MSVTRVPLRANSLRTSVGIGLFVLLAAPAARGATLYVDGSATGANDGSSWTDAIVFLQDALTVAAGSGKTITEIMDASTGGAGNLAFVHTGRPA